MESLNMNQCKLNLCSFGEPTNPKTWSGTPFRIYTELTRANQCGRVFNVAPPVRWKVLLFGLSLPLYGRRDLSRAPFSRYFCSSLAARRTRRSASRRTLHTGTFALPFRRPPKGQEHYLFCDSTWNAWSRFDANGHAYPPRFRSAAERLEKLAYDQVDHIFSISNYVREDLIHHYGVPSRKITVVGTGPGVIHPFSGPKDYSNGKILFVAKGRFQDKGGDLVLAAFRKALGKNPRLQLTIVGDNDYLALAQDPGVTTLGHVPLPVLQELFNSHTLFLMPALNEPWGLVYLEAMLCKMPIMGLNRNSFPEISDHGKYGFMLDDPDPDAVAEKLVAAYRNPGRLKEMGAAAHDYCSRRFSWEKTVTLMLKTIEERAA
jgi:glycosyltransferase involved in cell wall biosynthesis